MSERRVCARGQSLQRPECASFGGAAGAKGAAIFSVWGKKCARNFKGSRSPRFPIVFFFRGGRGGGGTIAGGKSNAGKGRGHAQLAKVLLDAGGAEAVETRRHNLDLLQRAPTHGAPRVVPHSLQLHLSFCSCSASFFFFFVLPYGERVCVGEGRGTSPFGSLCFARPRIAVPIDDRVAPSVYVFLLPETRLFSRAVSVVDPEGCAHKNKIYQFFSSLVFCLMTRDPTSFCLLSRVRRFEHTTTEDFFFN